MKYFQALALEVFTLDTNRPLDMDEPCHVESYHSHSFQGYSDVTIYYFEVSQYLIVSTLMGTILLKISTDIWLELALPICFYAGQMSS